MNRLFSNLFLICFSLFLTLALLEFSARYYLFNHTDKEQFQKYASLSQLQKAGYDWNSSFKFSFHRYIGYIPTPHFSNDKNKHNSLGYRGAEFPVEKPEGEFRVVCLGGSTTYTTFSSDYQLAYPYLLEQELKNQGIDNVRVINAGAGGWSSWETLANLQYRVLDLDPDLIVIYHGVNDIRSRLVWPHSAYRGDNSGYAKPNVSHIFMPHILENSTLVRMLLINSGLIYPHTAIIRTTHQVNKQNWYDKTFVTQHHEKTYPDGIFKQTSAMNMLQTNTPVYFKRNLENVIASADAHNIKTMFATFAYSADFNNPRVYTKEYQHAYQEHNNIIKSFASKQHVSVFDFASIFPSSADYYTDGIHVNEKGVTLKAKLFADFINKTYLQAEQ